MNNLYKHIGYLLVLVTLLGCHSLISTSMGPDLISIQEEGRNEDATSPISEEDGVVIRSYNKTGARLYHVENNVLRHHDAKGARIFALDGQTIRHHDGSGAKVYYIDGKTVRVRDRTGARVIYFDGPTIRATNKTGAALFI